MTTSLETSESRRVAIIDYGLSNIDSVARAVQRLGWIPYRVAGVDQLGSPSRMILPGVGVFSEAMRQLSERGLVAALVDEVRVRGTPLLGICLGMQLLATHGSEGGDTAGLGLIAGRVIRLEAKDGERVPHVGWNELRTRRPCGLLTGAGGSDVYFVHSYHFVPEEDSAVLAVTPFAGEFVSAIGVERVFGVQFHPEKSQRVGASVLGNFLDSC